MSELRFHRDLYDGPALDEAAKVYEPYASLSLVEEPSYWLVRVEGDDADLVARELANYALGLTIERRGGARGEGAAPGEGAARGDAVTDGAVS